MPLGEFPPPPALSTSIPLLCILLNPIFSPFICASPLPLLGPLNVVPSLSFTE